MKFTKRTITLIGLGLLVIAMAAYVYATGLGSSLYTTAPSKPLPVAEMDLADDSQETTGERELVLAGGCFWCTEAVFEQLAGVKQVVSGYSGGDEAGANYQMVSAGVTEHAESIKITYDPEVISYATLLKVFFSTAHDPTQVNRQGPDIGEQYRSTIFYQTEEEKRIAEAYIKQVDQSGAYPDSIATTLERFEAFYPAEEYHQDYVQKHPLNFYVRRWSLPKVRKTIEQFPELIRHEP